MPQMRIEKIAKVTSSIDFKIISMFQFINEKQRLSPF